MSIDFNALEEKNRAEDGEETPEMMGDLQEPQPFIPSGGVTGLEALQAKTSEKASRVVQIRVPGRDGVEIKVETDISAQEMREWTRTSRLKSNKAVSEDNVNAVLMASRGIASKTRGILVNGDLVVSPDEQEPLTFLDDQIKSMYNVRTPWDAVHSLFGSDSGVLTVWQAMLEEAGYANVVEPEGN